MTPQKTHIDWLRFRAQTEPRAILQALKPAFPALADKFKLQFQPRGMLGFQQAALICADDLVLGRMDYGGESQKGWVRVDIGGKGCEWMEPSEVAAIEELPSSQIRRLDIALTTWKNEVCHDQVVNAHAQGAFTTAGRPPNLQQILNSDGGRTCNIGKREKADKFMRCYEKGHEMLSKVRQSIPGNVTQIRMPGMAEFAHVDHIYRCEVEFKAVTKDIPWEAVGRRDHYFVGAYPFCAEVLPDVDPDTCKARPEREAQVSLATALENCLIQFGPTLFTAMHAYGGDITAVWEKVCGSHHSQPLLEAGVLLVDHE